MRSCMLLVLCAGVFSAESAHAQSPHGPWSINIPQIDLLPASTVWTLQDSGPTFTGTSSTVVQSVIRVDGTMTGRQLFGSVYVVDSQLTALITVPGLGVPQPVLPTDKALVIVYGAQQDKLFGWSMQSFAGRPIKVYLVQGTRQSP